MCKSSTQVLYLHHPLKGDEHIFTGGLQFALDNTAQGGTGEGGEHGTGRVQRVSTRIRQGF